MGCLPPLPAYVSSQEPPSLLPAAPTAIRRGCGVAKFQALPREERAGMLGFQPMRWALFPSIPVFRLEGRLGPWGGGGPRRIRSEARRAQSGGSEHVRHIHASYTHSLSTYHCARHCSWFREHSSGQDITPCSVGAVDTNELTSK